MNYEIKRRIKVLSSMLGFCIVFLAVVVLVRYGYLQFKNPQKNEAGSEFTPINVGESNRERKNSLEDALHN